MVPKCGLTFEQLVSYLIGLFPVLESEEGGVGWK